MCLLVYIHYKMITIGNAKLAFIKLFLLFSDATMDILEILPSRVIIVSYATAMAALAIAQQDNVWAARETQKVSLLFFNTNIQIEKFCFNTTLQFFLLFLRVLYIFQGKVVQICWKLIRALQLNIVKICHNGENGTFFGSVMHQNCHALCERFLACRDNDFSE